MKMVPDLELRNRMELKIWGVLSLLYLQPCAFGSDLCAVDTWHGQDTSGSRLSVWTIEERPRIPFYPRRCWGDRIV